MPDLGQRVRVRACLSRRASSGVDGLWRVVRLKSWERTELPVTVPGIFVGHRRKSNGSTVDRGPEEGIEYKPVAYFEVWLVAYDTARDIFVCLPSDVEVDDYNERKFLAGFGFSEPGR